MASVPQPQRILAPSTSTQPATQTIKLEDFLRMCKEAGLEQKTIVQQNQPIVTSQGLTTIVQRTQAGPQIQKIITTAPVGSTQTRTQTIKMDDILNLNSFKTQPQQPHQIVQQVVTTNPSTGQPSTQKLIVQMPMMGMANNNAGSPIKMSPFKTEAQKQQAAYNATKLHSYTAMPQSPVLNNSNRTSTLSSANNSPMSQKMGSPSQWGMHVNKRDVDLLETNEYLESKRFRREKGGKGLRHFSMKVCEKVQKKGVTSYNEVADELVNEFSDPRTMSPSDQNYDQKNIRRRVYDALNVLMAMNIISKEKKEIRWIGLPTNSLQECQTLEIEKTRRAQRIAEKKSQLQELLLQQVAFKNVVERNKQAQCTQGPPPPNSAIYLPYIIVNTSKKTVIDCSISNDKYEYLFNFDNTFEIHDDIEVLKRMGMAFGLEKGQCTPDDLQKAIKMVPKVFEHYIVDLANGGTASAASLLSVAARGKHRTTSHRFSASQQSHPYADASHRAPSRQSSVGSFSDIAPSRANTDTSDLLSDDDDMSD